MDAKDPVGGIGVLVHVEVGVAAGHDRRAVDDGRSLDPDEWAIAGAGDRAGLELGQGESLGSWGSHPSRAEIRSAREDDDRRTEAVRDGCRRFEGDGLDTRLATDSDVGQFWGVVDSEVICDPGVRRVQKDVPHRLAGRLARVQRKPHGIRVEIDLDRATKRELGPRQLATDLSETVRGA